MRFEGQLYPTCSLGRGYSLAGCRLWIVLRTSWAWWCPRYCSCDGASVGHLIFCPPALRLPRELSSQSSYGMHTRGGLMHDTDADGGGNVPVVLHGNHRARPAGGRWVALPSDSLALLIALKGAV